MDWEIYENGEHINTIYGKEDFVKPYCEANGYTYKLREAPAPVTVEQEADVDDGGAETGE